MDLGRKPTPLPEPATAPKQESKTIYPSASFSDEVAEAFRKSHKDLKLGDTFEGTVKIKITALTDSSHAYGDNKRVEFDLLSFEDGSEEAEPDGDEGKETKAKKSDDDGDEEKALGYKRPKVEKEAPDTSAASLV